MANTDQNKVTDKDLAAQQKAAYDRWQKEQDAERTRDQPRRQAAPVMTTITNVSKAPRILRDCFGATVTLDPSETKTIPMYPGAVEFLDKLNHPDRPPALHSALRVVKDNHPGVAEARQFVNAEIEKEKENQKAEEQRSRERVKPTDADTNKSADVNRSNRPSRT